MASLQSGTQDHSGPSSPSTRSTRSSSDLESNEHGHVTSIASTPTRHAITSRTISSQRNAFLKNFLTMLGLCTLVMWACLALFWGTSAHTMELLSTLDVQVVNFDTGRSGLGDYLAQALRESGGRLKYNAVDSASRYPGGLEKIQNAVRQSGPWAAVVVEGNTTSDTIPAVSIYYASARSHQVVLGTLLPLLERDLHSALVTASGRFMHSQLCSNSFTSSATIAQLLKVSRWSRHDVSPIQDWAVVTAFLTCLVWLTVLTFLYAFSTYFARLSTGLLKTSSLSSLLKRRFMGVTVTYVCLSLWYTCMYLVFNVDTAMHFGKGGGFLVLWTINCLTTFSVGLALEAFLSLLTPRFFPFLLVTLIICNLSSVIVPIALMHNLYRFAYAMPFYQNVQATKVVLFGNESRRALGRYFGVLGAWIVIMPGLFVAAQHVEKRRAGSRAVQKPLQDEVLADEKPDDARNDRNDAEKAEDKEKTDATVSIEYSLVQA